MYACKDMNKHVYIEVVELKVRRVQSEMVEKYFSNMYSSCTESKGPVFISSKANYSARVCKHMLCNPPALVKDGVLHAVMGEDYDHSQRWKAAK